MNIRITINPNDRERDVVTLPDRSRFFWRQWFPYTRNAVKTLRAAVDSRNFDPTSRSAYNWLKRCGVADPFAELEHLEQHVALLALPPDETVTTVCKVCGYRIWGRESLATEIGSDCRRKGKTQGNLVSGLNWFY